MLLECVCVRVGLYDVLIHSQGITYNRRQLARPQFREAVRSTGVGS